MRPTIYSVSRAMAKRVADKLIGQGLYTARYQDLMDILKEEGASSPSKLVAGLADELTGIPGKANVLASIARMAAEEAAQLRAALADYSLARVRLEDEIERRWKDRSFVQRREED